MPRLVNNFTYSFDDGEFYLSPRDKECFKRSRISNTYVEDIISRMEMPKTIYDSFINNGVSEDDIVLWSIMLSVATLIHKNRTFKENGFTIKVEDVTHDKSYMEKNFNVTVNGVICFQLQQTLGNYSILFLNIKRLDDTVRQNVTDSPIIKALYYAPF